MEFSSRLLILIILFTLLLTWYNFSLDWHVTQQFVWWQLIIKIPAPAADYFSEWIIQAVGGAGHSAKFYMGRLGLKVQPLTHLYIILDRKGTPFVDFLLTNGTPFTYLVQNFASLFTAVNVLSLKYEKITKPECFHNFFTTINASVSPCSPFYWPKWQISLPFHILQLVKSLATGRVPAGDACFLACLFRANSQGMDSHSNYQKSLNLAVTIHNSQKPFLFKSVKHSCWFLLPALLLR